MEDQFPYTTVPRIVFEGQIVEDIDGKPVAFDPRRVVTEDIHLTDTTFRDGQQARAPYTVEQTVDIIQQLAAKAKKY